MKKSITLLGSLFLLSTLVACNANPTSFEFKLKDGGEVFDFHTELQNKYINSEDYLFLKLNNNNLNLEHEQNQDSNPAGQVDGESRKQ